MSKHEHNKHFADHKTGSASRVPRPPKRRPSLLAGRRISNRSRQRRRPSARAQPRADQPSVFSVVQERYFPEGRGASRSVRIRAWAIYVVLTLLAVLGGFAGTYAYDLWSTESRLREQREAARAINQEIAPFTSSITYDTTPDSLFRIVLDRPLTAEEGERIQTVADSEFLDYLLSLGGRIIPYATANVPDPPSGGTWENGTGRKGSAVFTMNLMSTRTSPVSIVDMTPVNISCKDPAAVTVIDFPPQGFNSYPGVVVDLNHNEPVLYSTDEGPHKGNPFFENGRIDLGAGLDPGGLRVEAHAQGQSCEWEIQARYIDAQQETGETILRDGEEPFFVEVPPSQPEQYWMGYPIGPNPGMRFVPCHDMPSHPSCL